MKNAFSLVETAVAGLVLAVASMSLLATLLGGADARQSSRDGEVAAQAIRAELERFRALPMARVVSTITGEAPIGDPIASTAEPLLMHGVLHSEVLDEQACQAAFGLASAPDLDGDGQPTVSDLASYSVVPVRITVTWTSKRGPRSRAVVTLFYPETTGS
jgi:hypothetical protein